MHIHVKFSILGVAQILGCSPPETAGCSKVQTAPASVNSWSTCTINNNIRFPSTSRWRRRPCRSGRPHKCFRLRYGRGPSGRGRNKTRDYVAQGGPPCPESHQPTLALARIFCWTQLSRASTCGDASRSMQSTMIKVSEDTDHCSIYQQRSCSRR